MRDYLIRLAARLFPTERMGTGPLLASLWRVLFYAIAPTRPFVLRTERYQVWAYPKRGTLTRALIRRGHWEAAATRAFLTRLRPGGFCVDAGANFGHYAMTAANALGPAGLVIAFEPDPATFTLLDANAGLQSGGAQIRCVRAGLGAARATLPMVHDDQNPGGHSFVAASVERAGASTMIDVYALDEWLREVGLDGRKLDLIKIDVQGFEAKLIGGAIRVIERDRPAILCEIWPPGMRAAGDSHRDLVRRLLRLGYTAEAILDTGPRSVDEQALNALLEDGRAY